MVRGAAMLCAGADGGGGPVCLRMRAAMAFIMATGSVSAIVSYS